MDQTDALFQQLIEVTDELYLYLTFEYSLETEDTALLTQMLDEREGLLKQLRHNLLLSGDAERYEPLYTQWQAKDSEIRHFFESTMEQLDQKLKDAKNKRMMSNQYDSYLRQMPYGAFLDKKR
jgi:hypothetical protein